MTEWDVDIKGPEKHLFGTHPLQFRCFTSVPLFSGWALNTVTHLFFQVPFRVSQKGSLVRSLSSLEAAAQRGPFGGRRAVSGEPDCCLCGVAVEELPCTVQGCAVVAAPCPLGTSSMPVRSPAWTLRLGLFLVHTHVLSCVPNVALVGPCTEPAVRLTASSLQRRSSTVFSFQAFYLNLRAVSAFLPFPSLNPNSFGKLVPHCQ